MDEYMNDYLAHHGIKGQKWGVIRTPEELGHRTPTRKNKAKIQETLKYTKNKIAEKREEKKIKRKEKKEQDFIKKHDKLKQYLSEHPDQIYDKRKALSESDVDEIMKKVEWNKKCKDIQDEWNNKKYAEKHEKSNNKTQKLRDKSENLKTIAEMLTNGINAYNNVALIYNALYERRVSLGKDVGNMKPLLQIETNNKSNKFKVKSNDPKKNNGDQQQKQKEKSNDSKKNNGDQQQQQKEKQQQKEQQQREQHQKERQQKEQQAREEQQDLKNETKSLVLSMVNKRLAKIQSKM